MRIRIQILDGDEVVHSQEYGPGVYIVGRDENCDVHLTNTEVSRRHVEVKITETSVYFTNLSQTAQVLLNGEVFETAEISLGSRIEIGPYQILFEDEEAFQAKQVEAPEPMQSPPSGEEMAIDGTAALNMTDTFVQAKPLVAKLLFTEGPLKDQEMFLETFEVTFGRSKKADIYVDDEKLSRVHAKVARVGNGYRLIDLGSRNGTYVNGVRILEHPLNSYDIISFGKTKIKFVIHDFMAHDIQRGPNAAISKSDATKSIQLDLKKQGNVVPIAGQAPPPAGIATEQKKTPKKDPNKKLKLALAGVLIVGAVYYLFSGDSPPPSQNTPVTQQAPTTGTASPPPITRSTPITPQSTPEYIQLKPQQQRALEGYYTSALKEAERGFYDRAIQQLKKIHEFVPEYKESKSLLKDYSKILKQQQVENAQKEAVKNDERDLAIYLEEGLEALKLKEFERAAEYFSLAFNIDPRNETAKLGLKAAELKITNIEDVPAEQDPESEKRQEVIQLFRKAMAAFAAKSYSEAITTAEKIRTIELSGDTEYLNKAKQIIDRARMLQRDEIEPFLIRAREKCAEGDYNGCRELTEEILKTDPAYKDALELQKVAVRKLNKLAKEAYVRGLILENINNVDEAVRNWKRCLKYVRKGDAYFKKCRKKSDFYQ